MSEVTVKAIQPVLGLADGAVVTVERTPRIDAAINTGRLIVQGTATPDAGTTSDTPAPDLVDAPAPDAADDETESPRTKRVKKLAGLDKDTE